MTSGGLNGRTLVAAIGAVSTVGVALSLSLPLLSLRMEQAGLSGGYIGLNSAAGGLATVVAAPYVPRLAHWFGVRRLLVGAVLLSALVFLGFAYVANFDLWFPLRILYGFALTILFVLSEFWINSAAPEDRRGLVMGIYSTALGIGFAAGPVILRMTGTDGALPFIAGAGVILLATAPILLAGSQTPDLDGHASEGLGKIVASSPTATAAAFVFGAIEAGSMALLPVYGLRAGLPPGESALLVSLMALGSVLFQIPLGLLSDRMDRRALLIAIAIGSVALSLLMPLASSDWRMLAGLTFLWGGLISGLYPVALAHLGSRYRGAQLAAANAAFIMLYALGTLVAPPLMGGAMDLVRPQGLPLSIALMLGLYAVLVGARMKTRRN